MKEVENTLYPEDWKKVARKDWNRTKRNLRDEDAEAAGFFLQQALEKYLKAFLLERGWRLEKIHTLPTLLDHAVKYNNDLEGFRTLCDRVTDYYFSERYPQLVPSALTCEDVEKDMKEAKEFIETMFGEFESEG